MTAPEVIDSYNAAIQECDRLIQHFDLHAKSPCNQLYDHDPSESDSSCNFAESHWWYYEPTDGSDL